MQTPYTDSLHANGTSSPQNPPSLRCGSIWWLELDMDRLTCILGSLKEEGDGEYSKRAIAHRCYPWFKPWLHRQPNLQTRLEAAPIRTPWFRLTACYDPRPRSPDFRPRTLGAVRSRRYGPGHLPSCDGALVTSTSSPLDEPPLWRGCRWRVMRRTKEQSGDELGGSSLIAHGQEGDRGSVFSKPRKLQGLQSVYKDERLVLVPDSTGIADKRPPNTAMLQVGARPGRLSAP
ncbi:hypothetical protein TRIATDRAFT_286905 [Trichoderma atroviride IMI 206040]|uniref:Uncharacterized protein n=1 Tax=Hypocrea atroviridis (strain ATCC 20476 / IMI 206040) TaxID=452589 RepID=G9P664_HYPAI|nr:uncharacterized protein TRIATDRAFT_286905 [Trichoderma atroviride IMI 206040]EHK41396.1 hypothetical protein TRIATDRAFT_286905 [Trichoderma atroviride IMI 206040]